MLRLPIALLVAGLLALVAAPAASAAPGDLDGTWAGDGTLVTAHGGFESPTEVAVQPDGKVVVVSDLDDDFAVRRYLPSGEPDPAFGGGDGLATISIGSAFEAPNGLAILPDGRLLLVGIATVGPGDMQLALARFTPAGDRDPLLDGDGNTDGKVVIDLPGSPRESLTDPVLLPDGRFWAAGAHRDGAGNDQTLLARFLPSGALDTAYDGDGYQVVTQEGQEQWNTYALAATPDGGLIAAGDAWDGVESRFALTRFTAAGQLDGGFGGGDGRVVGDPAPRGEGLFDVAVDDTGRIVASGYGSVGSRFQALVARYTPVGDLDGSFGSGGVTLLRRDSESESTAEGLALAPDGRPVITGWVDDGPSERLLVGRLRRDGAPDPAFGEGGAQVIDLPEGPHDRGFATTVQPDGRVLAAGRLDLDGGPGELGVVRLQGSAPDTDEDGIPDSSDPCPTVAGTCPGGATPGGSRPGGTGPPGTTPLDRTAPVLSAVSLLRSRFAVGPGPTATAAQRRRRLARGTAFRLTVSEASTVTVALARRRAGRRRGTRCVVGRRRGRRCTRATSVGTLTRRVAAPGPVRIAFSGRVGSRALRPGAYRAVLRATDAAGNRSRAVTLAFRVVRRPRVSP